MRKPIVYPGQRIITISGEVAIVATVVGDRVYVYSAHGWLKAVDVVCDAYGGEHDQSIGLAA